jgi:hypothetical protein
VRKLLRGTLLAGVAALAGGVADARAQGLECGDVVTHDVVLAADLLDCPGDGLVVAGAGVTVDLNHHRIDGVGAGAGIRVLAPSVTLRKGHVREFQDGVWIAAQDPGQAVVAGLELSGNGRGLVLAGDFPPGQSGDGAVTVAGSAIHDNDGNGIAASFWPHRTRVLGSRIEANGAGIAFHESRGGTVAGSWIGDNELSGVSFEFSPGGRVTGNLLSGNGTWGLQANRSSGLVVSHNAVTRNGTAGLFGGGALVVQGLATIERNAFSRNFGNGLVLNEPLDSRVRWQIHDNTANRNTEFGIFAFQPGFTGTGNVARHNGQPTQCFNFPCNG